MYLVIFVFPNLFKNTKYNVDEPLINVYNFMTALYFFNIVKVTFLVTIEVRPIKKMVNVEMI
jgi:hypothetical protein